MASGAIKSPCQPAISRIKPSQRLNQPLPLISIAPRIPQGLNPTVKILHASASVLPIPPESLCPHRKIPRVIYIRNRVIRAPACGERREEPSTKVSEKKTLQTKMGQEFRLGCTRILLNRFHRWVGEAEFARERSALSMGLVEDCVEERGRLRMVASWSARTSSRRTSESDMRRCESLGSRISMNLEGVSRILKTNEELFCSTLGGGRGWCGSPV